MHLIFWGQAIGISLSAALGILLTQTLLRERSPAARTISLFAGWALGLGLSSLIWFIVWCMGSSGSPLVPVAVEFVILLLLLQLRSKQRFTTLTEVAGPTAPAWAFAIAASCVACAMFYFIRFLYRAPFAGWDAWAIWNLHARAFFAGGGIWKTALYRIGWSHPDYPLLLPLNVARLWFFSGRETPTAPALLAFLYTFGTAGLLGSALSCLKGPKQAVVATATLLALSKYVWLGLQEIADVPQSFYFLSALVTLAFYEETGNCGFLALAGFSSGLSVWNKNEGWMFLGCLAFARLLMSFRRNTWRISRARLFAIAGVAPPVIVDAIYKARNPVHSDVLIWYLTKSGWVRALDPHRLLYILSTFATTAWTLDTWLISPVLALVIYAAL